MNTKTADNESINAQDTNADKMASHVAAGEEKNTISKKTGNNKLIHLDTDVQPQARDLNSKISTLELELGQLNEALGSINASVEEGLDRLSDNDTNLTAKVSETYKRLGEIDNAYKALMDISVNLDTEISKITQNVSEVAEQSANGLKHLEEQSVAKNQELVAKNQHVVSRVNSLVENSRTTTEQLKQSIEKNTSRILSAEKQLLAEINSLASSTQKQAESVNQTLLANKAKVIKLQQVDEAIIRRATTLEITSGELEDKARKMSVAIQQLEDQSADLTEKVMDLIVHTQQLQDQADAHSGLINGLQTNLSDMTQSLLALTHLERKHFKVLSVFFVLALLTFAGLYYYQTTAMQKNNALYAQQAGELNNKIIHVDTRLQAQTSATSKSVAKLDSRVVTLGDHLKGKLNNVYQQVKQDINSLNRKLTGMNDQVQSLDGRINNSMMIDSLGKDNVVHGQQWLADQPADNYVIRLATVTDKNALYKIAQEYNDYLKDSLSYYTSVKNKPETYTLLYGSYANKNQAIQALDNMPYYIESQRPDIGQFKELSKL